MTAGQGGVGQNEQEGNKQLNLKFKNTVVIGVLLNESDIIREIDLNELSQENPFMHTLTAHTNSL